ncbi:MAG: hypothetical protein A2W72_00975 [Burkholderiales bacterium RIFCSPLOWO2_12_67_14]|nr:MAG: hypothetical protein A2W72_00975 [Burkholderiales bacterium RIFCSPLOWO2_12_67_14]
MPSKSLSTGPRKYSWPWGGGASSNRTRSAMPSSSASSANRPTRMLFDRPLRPVSSWPGMPHSGDSRGNSRNSTSMMGAPMAAMPAAMRAAWARGGRPTGMWALTSAVSRPSSAIRMPAAVSSDCEWKKWVSRVKKARKNTTKASRRARSSSVLSASSTTMSVTPASRPKRVRWVHQVAATVNASKPMRQAQPGNGSPRSAKVVRQASTPAVSAVHHHGIWPICIITTQAITASRNSVSRVSRGKDEAGRTADDAKRRGSFMSVFHGAGATPATHEAVQPRTPPGRLCRTAGFAPLGGGAEGDAGGVHTNASASRQSAR